MPFPETLRRFFAPDGPPNQPVTSAWQSRTARRMFWTGLLLRLLVLTLGHTYRFRATEDHFQFGWEMGRIARALVTGRGFSDPFIGHTGPTAWTPPLYPLLMAAAFKLFGVYTAAAAWAILAVNCVFSAATAPAIFELATRSYGPRPDGRTVPLWSGWLWVFYPAAIQYAVHWPWDMAITTCLFSWALVLGLRLRGIGSPSQATSALTWSLFGLLWGLIALLNSSVLLFLPLQTLWILRPLLKDRRTLASALTRGLLAALLFAACLAPWVIRNQRVFHAFVPMRSNFGAELYEAAVPWHQGFPIMASLPQTTADPDLQRYARMGELAYSKAQGERGKALIRANPGHFLQQVLIRIQFFWVSVPHTLDHGVFNEALRESDYAFLSLGGLFGLALSLHRRVPAAGLFAAAFAVLPLLYYLITVQARFRAPLEPLIAVLTVYLFQNADRTRLWSISRTKRESLAVP